MTTNLPTELLRAFVTVADAGSVTAAAKRLGLSQPAVSLQLQKLESLVGKALLDRQGRGLAPTAEGTTLGRYARQILALNDEALARLQAPAAEALVRVGLPNDFAVTVLPDLLGQFAHAHPHVTLAVGCELSADLLEGLEAGRYDVVVAMSGQPPEAAATQSWSERLAWTGPSPAGPEEALRLVAYPEGCVYRQRMTEALDAAGRPWHLAFTSSSLASLLAAIRAGLGVSVLSERTLPADLRPLPPTAGLPGLADVTVGLYQSRALAGTSAATQLVNHLLASLRRHREAT